MYPDIISDILLFVEVVNCGSFIGAAKKVGISKPSVSRRMNQLELRLKNQLIKRTTRKLSLTDAGRILYAQCREMAVTLEHAVQELQDHGARPTGKLKIGFSSYFANDFHSIAHIVEFMENHPGISVELHSFTESNDVDLIKKDIDVYFTDNDLTGPKLISKLLYQYPMILCASPVYLERAGLPKQIRDLKNHNCVLHYLYEESQSEWLYYKKNKLESITVQGTAMASRTHLIEKLVRAHLGVALLPEFMVRRQLQEGMLIALLSDIKFKEAAVYLTQYRHKSTPKRIQYFLDFIKSKLEKDKLK